MIEQFTFGLIGERIGYSRSPDIFRAIFREDEVGGIFNLYDIPESDFDRRFSDLLRSDIQGLAVTIPYKERLVRSLEKLDSDAAFLQCVNSITVGSDTVGYNTDIAGFALPLREYRDLLFGGSALILGAGGAARAAVWALHRDFGVDRVVVVTRSEDSLRLIRQIFSDANNLSLDGFTFDRAAEALAGSYHIVVNATPLGGFNFPGLSPVPPKFPWDRTGLYYDLNYNEDNATVARAKAGGIPALDGSQMLVAQAVASYRIWTGREVEFQPIYGAVFGDSRREGGNRER